MVYLKHLPRRIRMWNVVFKEKEEPENLEEKKNLEGRRDLTRVTSRLGLGPRPHWPDGLRDCPHPLPSSPPPPPPPPPPRAPMPSPLTIIFIPRQWILNREGWGGGTIIRGRRLFETFPSKGSDCSREAINRGTAIIRGNMVNISSV